MTKLHAVIALLVVIGLTPAEAQGLPPLVTGAAWKVKAPNGMEVQMTFNADGSGRLNGGFLSTDIRWSVQNGAFCIDGLLGGTNCMVLSANGNSVIGISPEGEQFVFERT